jgi:hypothetical protein
MARCDRYNVTIQSMNVTRIDDGFLGGDLEALFTFTVNGQAQVYENRDLNVGFHSIGRAFTVEAPNDAAQIIIAATGVEDDPAFDDPLVGFTRIFGQAQDWGVGHHAENLSDGNITYTLNYQIDCISSTLFPLPREVLLALGREKAATKKAKPPLSDEVLLASSLNRLQKHGWKLIGTDAKEYVFEGTGALPMMILQHFIRK